MQTPGSTPIFIWEFILNIAAKIGIIPETHKDLARKLTGVVKCDAIGGDGEGSFGASEEGEVAKMGVANGEVVADGDVVVAKVFVEHGVHVVEAVLWVFVFIELPYDDTSDVGQQTTNLDVMEHTVYLAHSLASILHKQDDARQ